MFFLKIKSCLYCLKNFFLILYQGFIFLISNHHLFLISVFIESLLLQNLRLWTDLVALELVFLTILLKKVVYISNRFHYHLRDIIFILNFSQLARAFHKFHFLLPLFLFLANNNNLQNFQAFMRLSTILKINFLLIFPYTLRFHLIFEQTFAYLFFCYL